MVLLEAVSHGAALRTILVGLLLLGCCAVYAPHKPGEPPPYCTVYNHMVKSGGTSIKEQMVQSSYIEGDAEPGLCTSDVATTAKQCTDALYESAVIMGYGELLRHPLEKVGRECEYFTMMRHPISRLVSAFYYCPEDHDQQTRPSKWCGNRFYPASMEDRLVDFAVKTKWGYMNFEEMLFGIYCIKKFELCEPEFQIEVEDKPRGVRTELGREVLVTMERMLSTYKAVGILEEWDLSMQLFNATVKSSVREWGATMNLNGGIELEGRTELLEWAYLSPAINEALAADLMLYGFALELFRQQTKDVLGTEWDEPFRRADGT